MSNQEQANNNNNKKQQQQEEEQQHAPLLIKPALVFSESIPLSELFCKPKLLPIRGTALERLEELDEKIMEQRKMQDEGKVAASKFGSDDNLGNHNNNNGRSNNASHGSLGSNHTSATGHHSNVLELQAGSAAHNSSSGGAADQQQQQQSPNNNRNNTDSPSSHGSGGRLSRSPQASSQHDVPLIAETFVPKIEDFSQYR